MTKYILIGSAITIALMGAVIYYLKGENEVLIKNNATLNSSILTMKRAVIEANGTIRRITRQRSDDQMASEINREELAKLRKESEEAKAIFDRHDLGNLTLKKPQLIENIINRGTKAIGEDLENLTK